MKKNQKPKKGLLVRLSGLQKVECKEEDYFLLHMGVNLFYIPWKNREKETPKGRGNSSPERERQRAKKMPD